MKTIKSSLKIILLPQIIFFVLYNCLTVIFRKHYEIAEVVLLILIIIFIPIYFNYSKKVSEDKSIKMWLFHTINLILWVLLSYLNGYLSSIIFSALNILPNEFNNEILKSYAILLFVPWYVLNFVPVLRHLIFPLEAIGMQLLYIPLETSEIFMYMILTSIDIILLFLIGKILKFIGKLIISIFFGETK